jgi:hypothetical protein
VFATQPHYRDHLLPIYRALPEQLKGGVHEIDGHFMPYSSGCVGLVAGGLDASLLRHHCKGIYVEHGAGQSYGGDTLAARQTPGYSLADGHMWPHIVGFIAPSQDVADLWTSAPSVAVGCPKMDDHILGKLKPIEKSVCFAWHWEGTFVDEARSAWLHYASGLKSAVRRWKKEGYKVFGHAHPRWRGALDESMRVAGMTVLHTDVEVFAKASILFVDNSSLGPEFSSLGRPVVWMNAPWYRRDVDHGKRFWNWTKLAHTIDGVDEIHPAWLPSDSADPHDLALAAYSHIDGRASERAAEFIVRRLLSL